MATKKVKAKSVAGSPKPKVQNAGVKATGVARKSAVALKPKTTSARPTGAKRAVPRYMPKVDFVTFFSSFTEAELKTVERIYDFLPAPLQDALDAEAVRRNAGERLIPAAEVLAKLK